MKLFTTVVLSFAACLPLANSFQNTKPRTVGVVKNTGVIPPPTSSSWSPSPSALFFSEAPPNDDAELEDLQRKVSEMTAALERAQQRQAESQEQAELTRAERAGVVSETDATIAELKSELSEKMTDLGDRIEGAQDDLWRVMSTTKSEISNIRGEVHEREERLYSEISDLEARLAALRQEGTEAAQDRDSARKSLEKEERGIRAASRTELNGAQRAAEGDKKALSRERWELENKMQRAAVSATPAVEALADAQRQYKLPQISSLTEALAGMKRKMTSQVEGLQKQRVANEMIFEEKLKKIKNEQLIDLDLARSVAEGEISAEERALDNATSYFNSELEAKEKELLRTSNLAAGPVDYAGFGAIEEARNKLVALWENKQQAVANATEDRATAMASTVDKRQAIAQRYDAEYENALRNLQAQEARGERRLQQEDRRRERRGGQLQRELRDLTRKLSRLLREEEAEAEVKYKDIQREKTAVLADTVSRARRATNEIEMVRSELTMVQYERKNLETTLQQKERQLSELEEERTSFRKQARRTVAVALGRITRRGSGARGK